jgi:hypothetical protein
MSAKMEDGRWKMEDGRWKMEVKARKIYVSIKTENLPPKHYLASQI